MRIFSRNFFLLIFFLIPLCAVSQTRELKFIPNKNQWPDHIQFSTSFPGGTMNIGAGRFMYYFIDGDYLQEMHERSHQPEPDGRSDSKVSIHAVQANFVNANLESEPQPFGRSEEYFNYFLGNDPARWAHGVHSYAGMIYPEFYRDIDLKVYSTGNDNIKYDFVVAPGGDPGQIRIRYDGATSIALEENGDFRVVTSFGEMIEKKPVAYQYINGRRALVKCEFAFSSNQLSFKFPSGYDPCYELVIDPLLIFSTYSGSTADNWGSTATPGEHGTLYSSGVTNETRGGKYPVTFGVFQEDYGGLYDIGILKYDSLGSNLLYSTYLGGGLSESPHSLVMDYNEDLIVLGTTGSEDFPVTAGAFQTTFRGGKYVLHVVDYSFGCDIFLARISRDGQALKASTFLGGGENDGLNPAVITNTLVKNYGDQLRGDVITDSTGHIYVSSVTSSNDFPLVNGFETAYQGGASDAIVLKMSADLSTMIWGAFLGGGGVDAAHTIKLDSDDNIFAAGGTSSGDFPIPGDGYRHTHFNGVDGWIAHIRNDGSAIVAGTYVGTTSFDQVYFLDLNAADEPYVFGQTNSPIFPSTSGVYDVPNSGQFIQKYNHELTSLLISTSFGSGRGQPDISPTAFLVNDCNNLYLSGWGGGGTTLNGRPEVQGWTTGTGGLYVTNDAVQRTTSGNDFYFMVLNADVTEVLYATFLGGAQSLTHVDGGTSRFDKNGIVYHAVCSGCNTDGLGPKSDFPTTPNAWSRTNKSLDNCNNAAFKFDLSSLKARIQTNSVTLQDPGLNIVCIPESIVFENFSIGGEIFQWDFGDGTRITRNDKVPVVHAYQSSGQYVVKLKAIDQGTCQVVDSTQVMVTVNHASSIVQDDDDVCAGDDYELKALGGIYYQWATIEDGIFSNDATPSVGPSDTTSYYVTINEANGCVMHDTVVLNVIPAIFPEFSYERVTNCLGRPALRLTNATDSTDAGDLLFFDFGDGQTSDLAVAEHQFEADGVYAIKLIANRHACLYESAKQIPMFKVTVPNIITPGNAEGLNDRLLVQFGEQPGITPTDYGFNVSLIIYNRWGRILVDEDNYQYDWTGEGLAAGIYFYDVTIQDHGSCKSWIQLVK